MKQSKRRRPGTGYTKKYKWTKYRHKKQPAGKGHERRQGRRAAKLS